MFNEFVLLSIQCKEKAYYFKDTFKRLQDLHRRAIEGLETRMIMSL